MTEVEMRSIFVEMDVDIEFSISAKATFNSAIHLPTIEHCTRSSLSYRLISSA